MDEEAKDLPAPRGSGSSDGSGERGMNITRRQLLFPVESESPIQKVRPVFLGGGGIKRSVPLYVCLIRACT